MVAGVALAGTLYTSYRQGRSKDIEITTTSKRDDFTTITAEYRKLYEDIKVEMGKVIQSNIELTATVRKQAKEISALRAEVKRLTRKITEAGLSIDG